MSLLQGFASVNDEPKTEQAQTLEAREARAIAAYEHALGLIQAQRHDGAQAALRLLLADPVVVECASDQLHRIKFFSLKNLGDLLARRGQAPQALAAYCQATEGAGDDAGLWNRLGTLAAEAGYWALARNAFERGLELDPQHPTLSDKLLQLLLHVGDGGAAAAMAAALLRTTPRHACAAAVLTAQRGGHTLPTLRSGLLQLAPIDAVAGAAAAASARQARHQHLERPRTLDQPSWQQLLHHSLLFLAANKLQESGAAHASTPTAAVAAAAGESGTADRGHKQVASLVRFTYKRPYAQPTQQAAAGAAPAAAAHVQADQQLPGGADVPAAGGAAASTPAAQPEQCSYSAPAEPVAAANAAGGALAATGELAAAAGSREGGAEATPLPSLAAASPAPADAGSSGLAAAVAVAGNGGQQTPQVAAPEATEEQQVWRRPGGRASSGAKKGEARATRSRAAAGEVAPPLAAAATAGSQATPLEEAGELYAALDGVVAFLQQSQQAASSGAVAHPLRTPDELHRQAEAAVSPGQLQPLEVVPGRSEEEAAAVKAFLKSLPTQGLGRPELALLLLRTLCTDAAAAQLAPGAVQQLLEVAAAVQHSVSGLPAVHCLVLGELFVSAAVAARPRGGSSSVGPWQQQGSTGLKRLQSKHVRQSEQARAQLEHSARLWLMRYRLAAAEEQPGAAAAAPAAAAAAEVTGNPQAEQLGQAIGMVRYWWAIGRLLEGGGDHSGASAAYWHCERGLALTGGDCIRLPHRAVDAAISSTTVRSKQEGLQLHSILAGAEAAAAVGSHTAVVEALVPVVVCCGAKEREMQQLHHPQWLHGVQLLLTAATEALDWALALRCHLRLLTSVLPAVPPLLAGETRHRSDLSCSEADAAAAGWALLPAALSAASDQLAVQPAAVAALDSAAAFLQWHGEHLILERSPPPSDTSATNDASQQQQEQKRVALHPAEQGIYAVVQRQLQLAVAACAAALKLAGPVAAESRLCLKVNSLRDAMCDSSTVLLCLSRLASGPANTYHRSSSMMRIDVAELLPSEAQVAAPVGWGAVALAAADRQQELAWHLSNALGECQALMERHGRFAQVTLCNLQVLQQCVEAASAATAPAPSSTAAQGDADAAAAEVDAEELRESLAEGELHCLFWLYGLDLPGRDDAADWGDGFQPRGTAAEVAARQLSSPEAVAAVWPHVERHLLQDIAHVSKHKGFLQAVAAHVGSPPADVAEQSDAAWRKLLASQPPLLPCDALDCTTADPMRHLLRLAATPEEQQASPQLVQQGVRSGALDGVEEVVAAVDQGPAGEEPYAVVYRSLYHLLAALEDEEAVKRLDSLMGAAAEAAVDAGLRAPKLDLAFNPARFSSWERLAVDFHAAADTLLNEASEALSHREWKHSGELPGRVQRWRRLAYWSAAGAWLSSATDDQRVRLLIENGSRLMEDALLRTLPVREPLGDQAEWRAAKRAEDGPYQRAARHVHAAFGLAAGLQEAEHGYPDWEVLLYMGRCLRKQQQAPANWLQHLARACHYGERDAGGVLLPVYSLHAARLRLLLGMASARRWAAATASGPGGTQPGAAEQQQGQQQASEGRPRQQKAVGRPPVAVGGAAQQLQEREVLAAAASSCFLPATNASLHSPSPTSRGARDARSPAAAGDAELAAHWRCLVEDCCAAMEWCLDRDRSFHRAAHRLAAAQHQLGEPHRAAATLAPLFSKAKQAFLPMMQRIRESNVDIGSGRGRRSGPGRRVSGGGEAEGGGDGGDGGGDGGDGGALLVPTSTWGQAPDRLSSVGLDEDAATFCSRLRKTTSLYLSCVADCATAAAADSSSAGGVGGQLPDPGRAPLDVLQAACAFFTAQPSSAKVYAGFDLLARGHMLMALVAGLRVICPLVGLEAPAQLPGPSPALETVSKSGPAAALAAAAMLGTEGSEPQDWGEQQAAEQSDAAARAAAAQTPWVGLARSKLAAPLTVTPNPAAGVGPPWTALPTPVTTGRQQLAVKLLQVAGRLDAAAAGPWLAKAHQVFSELSLHTDAEDRWSSQALPAIHAAVRCSSSRLAAEKQMQQLCDPLQRSSSIEVLRKLISLYACLYVHLLQQQGDADKLLQLLLAFKKRVKSFAGAAPRQARLLRRHALLLSDALLATLSASLASAELEAAGLQADAMDVDAPAPAAPTAAATKMAGEAADGSPAAASSVQQGMAGGHPAACSPPMQHTAPVGGMHGADQPAATPPAAVAAMQRRGATPATDLRAALGTPGYLPSSEQQQVAERVAGLLQLAHSFHRDIARWLQMVCTATAGSSTPSAVQHELRALGGSGEALVLRSYRLHLGVSQPTAAAFCFDSLSRSEQLKAIEEAVKQQRRQSRQAGIAARQQLTTAGGGAAGGGALAAVAESAEEVAGGTRKRGAPEDSSQLPARKHARGASAEPDERMMLDDETAVVLL